MSRLDVRERILLEIESAVLDGLSDEMDKQELIKELLTIINKYYE